MPFIIIIVINFRMAAVVTGRTAASMLTVGWIIVQSPSMHSELVRIPLKCDSESE